MLLQNDKSVKTFLKKVVTVWLCDETGANTTGHTRKLLLPFLFS